MGHVKNFTHIGRESSVATRYEKNEDFFVKLFSNQDMMRQVMQVMQVKQAVGGGLYQRLKGN